MNNNVLYHYGIKGQKWGVRRYQNSDGTLTAAGKKRAERDMSELSNNKQKHYRPNANKWVKEDMERSKKLAEAGGHLSGELKKVNETYGKPASKVKMDLSSMTDQQMRQEINRALLERQYNDMFAPKKVSKGKEFLSKTFEVAGTTLVVTGSALNVALAIKELRG